MIYDLNNRRKAEADPLGKRWTTIFNTVGRKDPLGDLSTSVYDTAGRVVASINPLALGNGIGSQ